MTTFYTPADLERYRGQKREILRLLGLPNLLHKKEWWPVEELETFSHSKRVASRIDELRDDWLIETRKNPATKRAMYRLTGKRTEPRPKKPHCETCTCGEPTLEEQLRAIPGRSNVIDHSADLSECTIIGVHEAMECTNRVPPEAQARLL